MTNNTMNNTVTRKQLAAIIAAKNAIIDLLDINDVLDRPDTAIIAIRNLARTKGMPILQKQALLAVLQTGTISWNGFRMPATAAVAQNWKKVGKDMKRGITWVLVDDPADPRADKDGFLVIRV